MKRIKDFLERWGRCHPSMAGKRSIIQMGPGGMSQYLATVQGMPKLAEKELTKTIRDFMWDGRTPTPVSLDAMCLPVEEGGLALLDVRARNEAIDLIWTKQYLALNKERPLWALAADTLISLNVSRDAGAIRHSAKINSFLQSWTPAIHKASKLPEYLKRMLSTARKYEVSFTAIKLDREMKAKLPVWYHLGATKELRRLNNSKQGDCLRERHKVRVVAEAIHMAKRRCYVIARNNDYLPDNCKCNDCNSDRARGCKKPWRCCHAAEDAIRTIQQKWHPDAESPKDGLTLTWRRKERNVTALAENKALTFDPMLTQRGDLSSAFRAFVDPSVHKEPPATHRSRGRIVTAESCMVNIVCHPLMEDLDAQGKHMGLGYADCVKGDTRSAAVVPVLEGERESPACGAVAAALAATLAAPRDAPLHFLLETEDLISMLFQKLPKWEDEGWIGVQGATYLKALVNQLRQCNAPTMFRKASTDEDTLHLAQTRAWLDVTLREGGLKKISPVERPAFRLSGARLDCLMQALAYRGIKERRAPPLRSTMTLNVTAARRSVKGAKTEAADIWKGLRDKDIRRPVADFLWKSLHGAH